MSRDTSLQETSGALLLAIKKGNAYKNYVDRLSTWHRHELQAELLTDEEKKAFWINIYNAYFIILRKYQKLDKDKIYTQRVIKIAGIQMSLDDIEHGILRKYRSKWSLGYLPNIFVHRWIKDAAVSRIDGRIHFALNCGAVSCPPIAFYKPRLVDSQLETAAYAFLASETVIDHKTQTLTTSKILQWYCADFGGRRGIRRLVKKYLDVDVEGYHIRYAPYNYDEHLDNFA